MAFRQLSARVGPREPNAARDILAALALKATLLFALYAFFFSPAHRPTSDAAQTANAVVGAQPAKDIP
jgi:hypothetical protein